METSVKDYQEIREKAVKRIEKNDELDKCIEDIRFYKNLYLTNPSKFNEVSLRLENVYVVIKAQRNKIEKEINIYNKDKNLIAKTDSDNRVIYGREITEEILKLKNYIKEMKEQGKNYKLPDTDKDGKIITYLDEFDKDLVTMNKFQREKYKELKQNGRNGKNEIKKDIQKNCIENKKENGMMKNIVSSDLGIKSEDIKQVTAIKDDLFYDNNPKVARNNAMLVELKTGEIYVVSTNEKGEYEKTAGFENSTAEHARANIITNDDNKIKEENTYGALYSENNKDVRYVITYGSYGAVKLAEERRITLNKSGETIEQHWTPGREVETDNTLMEDRNREGISQSNTTRNMYMKSKNYDINDEAARLQKSEGEEITVEDITDESNVRIDNAVEEIKTKLKENGIDISDKDEEKIREDVTNGVIEKDEVYSDETVEDYCKEYENEKEDNEERTLENDAINKRRRA